LDGERSQGEIGGGRAVFLPKNTKMKLFAQPSHIHHIRNWTHYLSPPYTNPTFNSGPYLNLRLMLLEQVVCNCSHLRSIAIYLYPIVCSSESTIAGDRAQRPRNFHDLKGPSIIRLGGGARRHRPMGLTMALARSNKYLLDTGSFDGLDGPSACALCTPLRQQLLAATDSMTVLGGQIR
jgi:hypothetical protein